MKRIVNKTSIILLLLVTMIGSITGCGQEEKQFDFENVVALKVYTGGNESSVEVLDKDQVQQLIAPIADITWAENQEESTVEYKDWMYHVVCYDSKGEKRQTIYICKDSRIMYRSSFWDAEDEGSLNISSFEELFQ